MKIWNAYKVWKTGMEELWRLRYKLTMEDYNL